ncbi:MAG TPA: hypothetical protein VEW94_03765 [Chloroflexia bacterium]|nr:hypothetical protein [Chloroflexia bacterium]
MRRTIACLSLLVLLGLLAACGEANTGTEPVTPQSTSTEVAQPTEAPTLTVAPTSADVGVAVADPTLPAVVAADPTPTPAPEQPTAVAGKPSLIFFTAPG